MDEQEIDESITDDWIEVNGWVAMPEMSGVVIRRTEDDRVRIENEGNGMGFTFTKEQVAFINRVAGG